MSYQAHRWWHVGDAVRSMQVDECLHFDFDSSLDGNHMSAVARYHAKIATPPIRIKTLAHRQRIYIVRVE